MNQSDISEQSCNRESKDHFSGPLCCIDALPWSANQMNSRDVNEQFYSPTYRRLFMINAYGRPQADG